jgi:hypothetical protein
MANERKNTVYCEHFLCSTFVKARGLNIYTNVDCIAVCKNP